MRGEKRFGFILFLMLAVSLMLGNGSYAAEPLKVAFVYVSPVGDYGWTYAHDQGRKALEQALENVQTAYTESVAAPDAERVIRDYAQKGYKVIFTTSFEYMDPTIEVARDFPDTIFEHCSGFKQAPNAGNYFGRMYQARYLSGLVAGKMTKSNVLGYVAAHPIPEVIRGINAFTLGVREVNPQAVVKVVWTGSWYDPAKEKEAALSLIEAGADVLVQHQDSPATQEAAQERKIYSVGYNTDMSSFAPDAHLTAPVWNWAPYYVETVKSVREGTWKSRSYWKGMESGVVGLAPYGKMVPPAVQEFVEKRRQAIIEGKSTVWADKTDQELLSMNYFIEGVQGTIPQ